MIEKELIQTARAAEAALIFEREPKKFCLFSPATTTATFFGFLIFTHTVLQTMNAIVFVFAAIGIGTKVFIFSERHFAAFTHQFLGHNELLLHFFMATSRMY
jgi:hypothetical protein